MESTHGCDGHELHLAHSFLAPLVFNDEFKREVLIEKGSVAVSCDANRPRWYVE